MFGNLSSMKPFPSLRLTLLVSALSTTLGSAIPVSARTWTNRDGRTIEAELTEATETEAVLQMANRQTYRIPLDTLSEADRTFVAEWLKKAEKAEGENWDSPWPSLISGDIDPEIEVIKEEAPEFIYASPHYEFHCDVRLSASVVKRFAVLFEATNQYVRELPLSMQKARREQRHKIQLFEHRQSYISAGGPESSAGVYMGGKDIIMIPLTSLGVEKVGSGYMVDHDKSNKTLPHEIFHQLTDPPYHRPGTDGWFTEGLAEYVALTPYRAGKFRVSTVMNELKEYVTGYGRDGNGGRAIGDEVTLPHIKEWFLQPYSQFLADPQVNYGMGALITYYFFHMDGNKDAARIKAMLKAMKQGKKGEEALAVLLDGRSYTELEEEITAAWRSRGMRINWLPPSQSGD